MLTLKKIPEWKNKLLFLKHGYLEVEGKKWIEKTEKLDSSD